MQSPVADRETLILAFIVGMSRSGTAWLRSCLDLHPEIAAFGETGFWGKNHLASDVYTPKESAQVLRRIRTNCDTLTRKGIKPGKLIRALAADIEREQLQLNPKELFDRVCVVIAEAAKKPRVIEKTPHHINWIDRISTAYPFAKFLIMTREPYGFMLSYKHQGDRKKEEVRERFRGMYHPIGCALLYRGYVNAILNVTKKYGEKTLLIDYSRLVSDPEDLLEEVQQFLGVDRNSNLVLPKMNTSFPADIRPSLSPDDYFWMNRLAGAGLKKLGYEKISGPRDMLTVLRSIIILPKWIWSVFNRLARYQMAPISTYIRNLLWK